MGYPKLKKDTKPNLKNAATAFIRESCEGLGYDAEKEKKKKRSANI